MNAIATANAGKNFPEEISRWGIVGDTRYVDIPLFTRAVSANNSSARDRSGFYHHNLFQEGFIFQRDEMVKKAHAGSGESFHGPFEKERKSAETISFGDNKRSASIHPTDTDLESTLTR